MSGKSSNNKQAASKKGSKTADKKKDGKVKQKGSAASKRANRNK